MSVNNLVDMQMIIQNLAQSSFHVFFNLFFLHVCLSMTVF